MWILPTRQRIEKLTRMCKSALETKTCTPCLIMVQKDEYFENQKAYERVPRPGNWQYMLTHGDTMGDKFREFWAIYHDEPEIKWVGSLNDDFICHTKNWDTLTIRHLQGRVAFVNNNDLWQSPRRIHGALIISMEALRAMGYIYPPGLQHSFIDDIWELIGTATQSWVCDMSVMVEHHHINRTGTEPDSTWHKVQNNFANDQEVYREWLINESKACIERVRAWQATKEPQNETRI